nr:reverse transcriptase domain-containing protein [Tanacetum cinerariifolium]
MSYLNHPTSDIEDAFSSNFSDYISASSDYFPASSGNTSFDSNSFGLVPIASPTLLRFHDDPYMKVVQVYDATNNESPISLPREILPPHKQAHFLSLPSSDLSAQPQVFEIGDDIQNSYAKPIGIKQADKIAWTELKRLFTNKYCPRTEVKKMEDEFYNLVVKENDLNTYARRF